MRIFSGFSFQLCFPGFRKMAEYDTAKQLFFLKLLNNVQHCLTNLADLLPVHRNSYSLLIKIPRAHQICTGKVGGIKPPSSLGKEMEHKPKIHIYLAHIVMWSCSFSYRYTWIRPAAGLRLFSKCFCLCCSWTLRAKPEPRMPCTKAESPQNIQWPSITSMGQDEELQQQQVASSLSPSEAKQQNIWWRGNIRSSHICRTPGVIVMWEELLMLQCCGKKQWQEKRMLIKHWVYLNKC